MAFELNLGLREAKHSLFIIPWTLFPNYSLSLKFCTTGTLFLGKQSLTRLSEEHLMLSCLFVFLLYLIQLYILSIRTSRIGP